MARMPTNSAFRRCYPWLLPLAALGAGCRTVTSQEFPALRVTPEVTRGLQHTASGYVGCKPSEITVTDVHHDWALVERPGYPGWNHDVLTWAATCGNVEYRCIEKAHATACARYVGPGSKVGRAEAQQPAR